MVVVVALLFEGYRLVNIQRVDIPVANHHLISVKRVPLKHGASPMILSLP